MRMSGFIVVLLLTSAIAQAQPLGRPSNTNAQVREQATRLGGERNAAELEKILRAQDLDLLRAYAHGFRETGIRLFTERKSAVPLPEDIEALMVRYYPDPVVGGPLRTLCNSTGALSRSRALFDLMFAEWRSGKVRPEAYTVPTCVLQTEAAGVEAPLLAWIVAADPPRVEDKRRIVDFLGKRKYVPAVPALAALLRKGDDAAGAAALALLAIGTPDAIDAAIERLAALRRKPPGANTSKELTSLVRRLATLPVSVVLPYARLRAALPEDVRELALPWLRQRKDLAAVPDAFALLSGNMTYSPALDALVATDSPEVWKKTRREIDRLRQQQRLSEAQYLHATAMLDDKIANPEKHFAQKRYQQQEPQLRARHNALVKAGEATRKLRESDPDRYVAGMREYLAGLESLALEYEKQPGAVAARGDIATDYLELAHFVRFKLKRPREALQLYVAAQRNGDRLGDFAVADTLQFDLRDSSRALEEYRKLSAALAAAPTAPRTRPLDHSITRWARRWLDAQIQYLETGKTFSGTVEPMDIDVVVMGLHYSNRGGRQDTFNLAGLRPEPDASAVPYGKRGVAKNGELARVLKGLPASSFVLVDTLDLLGSMPDARSILAFLARHDPAGFTSASYFGAVDLAAREARVDLLDTQLFRSVRRGGKANPLLDAQKQFMREHRSAVQSPRHPGVTR